MSQWSPTTSYNFGDSVEFQGQTYYLVVSGSNYVIGTPPGNPSVWSLSAPAVQAPTAAATIDVTNINATTASIALNFEPDNAVSPPQSYTATVTGGSFSQRSDLSTNAILLYGLTPNTTYTITTIAFTNTAGTTTGTYTVQFITTVLPPAPITNVTASAITNSGFSLSWTGGDGVPADFAFTLNDTLVVPSTLTATTASFTGLTSGTIFVTVVYCENDGGAVQSTPIVVQTLGPAPSPPVTPIATLTLSSVSPTTANFSYTGGDNATTSSFILNNVAYPQAVFNLSAKTVAISGLTQNTSYTAQILLDNSYGNSQTSPTTPFTTSNAPPPVTPITNLTLSSVTSTTANFSYTGGDNATSSTFLLNATSYLSVVFNLMAKTVAVSGLTASTGYNAQIVLGNANGANQTSPTTPFTTSSPTPPPTSLTSFATVTFMSNNFTSVPSINYWGINTSGCPNIGSFNFVNGTISSPGSLATCNYLKSLQANGVKIIASLGGATANVATMFPNAGDGTKFIQSFCNSLMGGSCPNPLNFSNATFQGSTGQFFFDGLDLDLENTPSSAGVMAELVSAWNQYSGVGTIGQKYLNMAPQTPNLNANNISPGGAPFTANNTWIPYAQFNSLPNTLNSAPSNALWQSEQFKSFDYIFIQAYNQGTDYYLGGIAFVPNLAQWGYMALAAQARPNSKRVKIVTGFASSDGTPIWNTSTDPALLNTALTSANTLIQQNGFPTAQISDWCGGIGFWVSPTAIGAMTNAYTGGVLTNLPVNATITYQLSSDPGWTSGLPIVP